MLEIDLVLQFLAQPPERAPLFFSQFIFFFGGGEGVGSHIRVLPYFSTFPSSLFSFDKKLLWEKTAAGKTL